MRRSRLIARLGAEAVLPIAGLRADNHTLEQGRGPASGRATSESKTLVAVRTLRRALHTLSPWLATIGFFVIWEMGCRVLNVPAFILPTPSAAVAALIQYYDGIWLNATSRKPSRPMSGSVI